MLILTMYFVDNLVVTIILTSLIILKYSYFIIFVKPVTKKEFLRLQEDKNV